MIRLGLQIPNFTYPGVTDEDLFEAVATVAVAGEAGRLRQRVGDGPLLPAADARRAVGLHARVLHAARRAWRRAPARVRLGTLVTGVTYRNPAILAKQVTTLDVISRGPRRARDRSGLVRSRARRPRRHLPGRGRADGPARGGRCRSAGPCSATSVQPSAAGTTRSHEAINQPPPLQPGGPPILIGGQGERRTLEAGGPVRRRPEPDLGPGGHPAQAGGARPGTATTSVATRRRSTRRGWRRPSSGRRRRRPTPTATGCSARGALEWDDLDEATRRALTARILIGTPESIASEIAGGGAGAGARRGDPELPGERRGRRRHPRRRRGAQQGARDLTGS